MITALVYLPSFLMAVLTLLSQRPGKAGLHSHHHGERLLSIDLYAHQSRLADVNAWIKIALSLTLLVFCVFSNNPYVALLAISLCALLTVAVGGLALTAYLRLLSIPIAFIAASSLVILLEVGVSCPQETLFALRLGSVFVYCTQAGARSMVTLWAKAFGGVSALYFLILSTSVNEIFGALEQVHVPALFIELMNMMYRFIFVLLETQAEMTNAAASRLGFRDYRTSLRSFGLIAGNLFIVSLKKANAYYDSLESRLYNGRLSFLERQKEVKFWQVASVAFVILYLVLVLWITK